jgi:hypothetical protein
LIRNSFENEVEKAKFDFDVAGCPSSWSSIVSESSESRSE